MSLMQWPGATNIAIDHLIEAEKMRIHAAWEDQRTSAGEISHTEHDMIEQIKQNVTSKRQQAIQAGITVLCRSPETDIALIMNMLNKIATVMNNLNL